MTDYITPNEHLGANDAESIRNAIAHATRVGNLRIRIPRVNARTGEALWVIGETVYLPSDIEILFDDAHLVLEDGCVIGDGTHEQLMASCEEYRLIAQTQMGDGKEGA